MPIYEFKCAACGAQTEELMRVSDPDPTLCPHCGAAELKRMVSAPSFRLAGSGWYETDFKKDGDKKRNLSGESPPPSSEAPAKEKEAAGKNDKPAKTTEGASSSASSEKPKPKADSVATAATPVAKPDSKPKA